ncbi:hypothetical protein GTY54_28745 [Streptomyces sp. SID625]|nr:hypothetical protein [Streptomyces sp. SID625]
MTDMPDPDLAVLPAATSHGTDPAAFLPAWEAVYEPGNVSDYLIGYANAQDAATGMAEAWLRSQAEVTGRLEWTAEEQLATGRYDRWFELIERHDDGVDTGPGIVVRRRMADEGPLSPYYEHPECGFYWHGRDGMDVPMRDGQPVCPRCELRRVADETAATETQSEACPPGCVACATDESHDPEPAAGARQDGAQRGKGRMPRALLETRIWTLSELRGEDQS